jgi:transcriptional regulator with XRE-family HTH domain
MEVCKSEDQMTDEERDELAELFRVARARKDLSAREVARRAGVDNATVRLLERSRIREPRVQTVRAIGDVLGIPATDIYALVHWLPEAELPSLRPYMRAKYADLPEAAVSEVEQLISDLTTKHGTGPRDHEDED